MRPNPARLTFQAALFAAGLAPAAAQVNTWNGNANSNWFNAANWSGGVPVDNQLVLFNANAPFRTLDLAGLRSARLDRIQFQGSGIPSFTVQNGDLDFIDGGFLRIANNAGPVTQRITARSNFLGAGVISNESVGGVLRVEGDVSFPSAKTLTVAPSAPIVIDGRIEGGAVNILGLGVATFGHADNTYTGPTTISSGVLEVSTLRDGGQPSSIGASSDAAGNLIIDGGTLRLRGNSTQSCSRTFTLGVNGGAIDAGSGAIWLDAFGSANVTLAGVNTPRVLELASNGVVTSRLLLRIGDNGAGSTSILKTGSGTWSLTGSNTFSGTVLLEEGELEFTTSAVGSNASYIVESGATLVLHDTSAFPFRLASLAGEGSVVCGYPDALNNLEIGASGADTVFSGPVSQFAANAPMRLTKVGTGTLTLTGQLAYTGGTEVRQGLLEVYGPIHDVEIDSTLVLHADSTSQSIDASSISGPGTLIKRGPGALMATAVNPAHITIDGGSIFFSSLSSLSSAAVEIRDGLVVGSSNFEPFLHSLGGGPGQVRITGGLSGFGMGRNGIVNLGGSGETVTWGSAHFNPQAFYLHGQRLGLGNFIFENPLNLGGETRTIHVRGEVELSGPLSNGNVVKTGDGELHLNSHDTTTGFIEVDEGTLRINGAVQSQVNVLGGILRGIGTINGPVLLFGILAPRGLTVTGDFTFAAGSQFETFISGTDPGWHYSQLRYSGSAALNLNTVALTFEQPQGFFSQTDKLYIIDNRGAAPTTGAFTDLPDRGDAGTPVPALAGLGGFDEWRIYYHADAASGSLTGGNDVALSPTPLCAADLSTSADPNHPGYGHPDGITDSSDFFYYLDQFAAANAAVADLTSSADPNHPDYGNPDGAVDASDFFYYLDLFAAGCP